MTELLVALVLIAGIVGAHEIGFWLGSLTRSADDTFDRQVGLVRTSTAALVAFLIGFAFSGAASRFIDRQDLIVKEANALGTAYLRADTIAEPQRGELKAALKEYTADRVTLLSREGRDQIEPLLAKVSGLHERMWKSATKATQDMTCAGGVCTPTAAEAVLNAGDLEGLLGSGNVEVTTTGSGVQAGSIAAAGKLTWSTANTLTLDAYTSVTIKRQIRDFFVVRKMD